MRKHVLYAIVGLLVCAGSATATATAQAGYYFSKRDARAAVKDYARDKYGMSRPFSVCRPQGRSAPEPGYIYHRWVCAWLAKDAGDLCYGQVLIMGSRDRGMYWSRVLRGMRCE
jgi:hypothetical protein